MQLDEQARLVAERGMVLIGNEEVFVCLHFLYLFMFFLFVYMSCICFCFSQEDEDAAAFDAKTTDEEQEKRTRAIVSAETNTILSGEYLFIPMASVLESFQDFLIELDMKPRMHLVEISIFY